jgi:endo-1,4-beta-xylanase
MTIWGISDKDSWIPSVFPGYGAANLFDSNYNKKPAYYGILATLDK